MAKTPTPAQSAAPDVVPDSREAVPNAPIATTGDHTTDTSSADVDADASIEARVLVDFRGHKANTLVTLTVAEAIEQAEFIDVSAAAVAYVKSLG